MVQERPGPACHRAKGVLNLKGWLNKGLYKALRQRLLRGLLEILIAHIYIYMLVYMMGFPKFGEGNTVNQKLQTHLLKLKLYGNVDDSQKD